MSPSNRQVWKHCPNVHLLCLPPGKSIRSVDSSALLLACARSVALLNRWKEPFVHPKRHLSVPLHNHARESVADCEGWRSITQCILPGGKLAFVSCGAVACIRSLSCSGNQNEGEAAPDSEVTYTFRKEESFVDSAMDYERNEDGTLTMVLLREPYVIFTTDLQPAKNSNIGWDRLDWDDNVSTTYVNCVEPVITLKRLISVYSFIPSHSQTTTRHAESLKITPSFFLSILRTRRYASTEGT
jgi:hypothetical protein